MDFPLCSLYKTSWLLRWSHCSVRRTTDPQQRGGGALFIFGQLSGNPRLRWHCSLVWKQEGGSLLKRNRPTDGSSSQISWHSLSQKGQNKTIIRVAHQHARTLLHPMQTHWLGTSWLLALIATSRSATRALKNTMSTLQSPSLWNCLSEPSYRSGANVIIAS